MASRLDDLPHAPIDSRAQWRAWLQRTKLDEVEALTVPKDLAAAFRKHAGSAANFSAFPRSVKRGILER